MSDRLERLTNLLAQLLDARRPLTLEELLGSVPGYPAERESARRQFERDKDTLRGIGIPVRLEPVPPGGGEVGYRVHPDDYYLPDLGLDPAERAALHVAATALPVEAEAARDAIRKLGGLEGAPAAPFADLPSDAALPALFEACGASAAVRFGYRGETRRVAPYGLAMRHGRWYLVGLDLDRDDQRTFRVDRIEGAVEPGEPGRFPPPAGFDPRAALRTDPIELGTDAPVEALVRIDASHAALALRDLGEDAVRDRHPEGDVTVALSVVNRAAFRAWVLGFLDHAEVIDPADLRTEVVNWLETVAASGRAR